MNHSRFRTEGEEKKPSETPHRSSVLIRNIKELVCNLMELLGDIVEAVGDGGGGGDGGCGGD